MIARIILTGIARSMFLTNALVCFLIPLSRRAC